MFKIFISGILFGFICAVSREAFPYNFTSIGMFGCWVLGITGGATIGVLFFLLK